MTRPGGKEKDSETIEGRRNIERDREEVEGSSKVDEEGWKAILILACCRIEYNIGKPFSV